MLYCLIKDRVKREKSLLKIKLKYLSFHCSIIIFFLVEFLGPWLILLPCYFSDSFGKGEFKEWDGLSYPLA